jgi:hypothetical protein
MNSILRKLTMISALVLVIAGISISVGRSQSVSEPRLGAEWQCSRTAFFITICAQVPPMGIERTRFAQPEFFGF